MSTIDRIATILREQLMLADDKQITAETRLAADLGCDSLDQVELTMFVEDEFDIEIPDEEADKVTTVGDLVQLVDGRVQA